jgi:hypothetical protein
MRLRGLGILTFSLALTAPGCATRDASVSELPPPSTSAAAPGTSTRDGGGLTHAPPGATECEATFRLCAAYVKASQVVIFTQDSRPSIAIELTEDGRQSFEAFTKVWLRRSVCVTLGSELVVAAPVRAVIPSGRLSAVRSNAKEAQELADKLQAAPEAPCGS